MSISDDMNPHSESTDDLHQRCEAWLERRDEFLAIKSAAYNDGAHLTLKQSVYDPAYLVELAFNDDARAWLSGLNRHWR